MKKQTNRVCLLIGICLLIVAGVVLLFWQWSICASQQKSEDYVQTIRTLIPEPQGALLEARRDNTMPVLAIAGTNFAGILEMPKYGASVPVGAEWGAVSKYPCRLSGSIYDRTMNIGGTSQKGQFDFYREISVGDGVFFTDMEGNRFSYEIADICYEKHADQAALQQNDAALTLFIKNIYAFQYIILFCNTAS